MPKFIDMTGQKFNWLTVLSRQGVQGKGQVTWLCRCDCGNETVVRGDSIRNGHTVSCGCQQSARASAVNKTHGMTRSDGKFTKVYKTWRGIKTRCTNPNFRLFSYYGGRGIKVCERWQTFDNFLADMGEPPTDQHSIDRMDANGNYCPENCRWATDAEQGWNKRSTRFVDIGGILKPMAVWIREYGIGHGTVYKRMAKGMTPEEAITTPVKVKFRATQHRRPPCTEG